MATPYTRRMVAAGVIALTITATGIASQPNGKPSLSSIAPGGIITSVHRETVRSGWPHEPTMREMSDVSKVVLFTYVPKGRTGSDSCTFRVPLGRATCSLSVGRKAYIVRVRIFEDGSYRLARVAV